MRAPAFLLLLSTVPAFAAGPVVFGVRGGASFNENNIINNYAGGSYSPSRNYLVGPTVGVRLPLGFSVEGDALYNRQTLSFGQFSGFNAFSTHSDSWEFPVMAKWSSRGTIAPILGAGVSVRHINNFGDVPSYLFTGSTQANTVGFVAGAGLRLQVGPASIVPEVRYTRWNGGGIGQSLMDLVANNRNQAQVLIGITF